MTKTDVIRRMARTASITNEDANVAFNAMAEAILESLQNGERVTIPGVGNFIPVAKKARTCRNPKTGEPVEVPAKKGVKFAPAKSLKEKLNK
jgi:DNA-binding protein HU-beta